MYSRITGYYRPVQNWNDGKAQEFRDRKVYDIGHSSLHKKEQPATEIPKPDYTDITNVVKKEPEYKLPVIVTTATCPNCKLAKSLLDKAGISYETKLATDNMDYVTAHGIKQAPTLIVDDSVYYKGVSEIRGWIKKVTEAA